MSPSASECSGLSRRASVWFDEDFEPGLVTVIIPTYNRAHWIGHALDSVEAQTWPQLEIIVVDDGSTDGTAKLLGARGPIQMGHRMRVLTQANAGVGAARNKGTQAARGEYIVYLDSDDMLFPDAIKDYVECLVAHDAKYCFAPIDSIDENGEPANDSRRYHPNVRTVDFLMGCFWLVHGACYRREVLNAAGPWNTTLPIGEDYEFLWRIKATAGRGYYMEKVTGVYRQHSRDQLHHRIERTQFYRWKLSALDLFAAWLRSRGYWNPEVCLNVAKEYRFTAMRLAGLGAMTEKNHALKLMQNYCCEIRHPLALVGSLRLINAQWFYLTASRFQYWKHRRRAGPKVKSAAVPRKLPSLLFISPIFPDAEGVGPARRAEMMVRALSLSHQVTLLVVSSAVHASSKPVDLAYLGGRWAQVPFAESGWLRHHRMLERRFAWLYAWAGNLPIEFLHAPARCLKARLAFEGQNFDVVHAFRLAVADCALQLRRIQPLGTKFHLDIDDIESLSFDRLAGLMRLNGERKKADELAQKARAFARAERRLLPRFDRLYVTSESDRKRLSAGYPEVRVLPNVVGLLPVKESEAPAQENAAGEFRLLFVGLLSYYPNADAVKWFSREVIPLLRLREVDGWRFVVGGYEMPESLEKLLRSIPEVECLGTYATTREGFSRGDALVVPLRTGAGTRIKILEAFKYGKPVISTAAGIEGIEAVPDRDYLPAETPPDFVRQISRLRHDSELRASLVRHAGELVRSRYSLKVAAEVVKWHNS
jgi:polysaccharide biosynthesis protein PslH